MTPEAPAPENTRLKVWAVRLLKAALTFLALYFTWRLMAGIRWSDLAHRIAATHLPLLSAGIVLLVIRFSVWDWRFRLACARVAGDSPGALLGFFVLAASAALNLITPSARLIGGLVRARYFARSIDRSFGFLYGVVLYDQVAHHTVMTTCTWLTVIVAGLALGQTGLGFGALAALVAVIAGLAIWSRRSGSSEGNPLVRLLARRAEKAEGRMQRFYTHGHEAVGVFVRLLGEVPLRWQAGLLGLVYFIVNAVAQWLIFLALGERVSPLVVVAGVALGHAAGALTGTPGGLGTTEAAMVASFEAMGVDPIEAAAGTLLFRGLHYAIVLAIGLPSLLVLEIRLGGDKPADPIETSEPVEES